MTPFFSVIIPAYNNESYLPRCLDSLLGQSWGDWEAIVVVDGSPDDCAGVVRSWAERDARIRPLVKDVNEGTHLARTSGVEVARGQYALFLDADDELAPEALALLREATVEAGADVLHFGTELFGENMPERECAEVLALSNIELPPLHGAEIPRSSFVACDGERQDWRVLQRVMRTSLLKRAFSAMTDERLGRGQDSYEWLVISSLARTEVFRNDLVCYRYFYGRGITTNDRISPEAFLRQVRAYASLVAAARRWRNEFGEYDLAPCVEGLSTRLYEMLAGDWHVRLAPEERGGAARAMAASIGGMETAAEVMRLARDVAYEAWVGGADYDDGALYVRYFRLAEDLAGDGEPTERYRRFSRAAAGHIADVRARSEHRRQAQPIKNRRSAQDVLRGLLGRIRR